MIASGIEGALSSLSMGKGGTEKHPEKRMKAAYKAYEEEMLVVLREEHKGLKLSQMKQKIFEMVTKRFKPI